MSERVLCVDEALDVGGGEGVLYAWAVVVEVIGSKGAFRRGVVGDAAEFIVDDGILGRVVGWEWLVGSRGLQSVSGQIGQDGYM